MFVFLVCVCVSRTAHATVHMWRSEYNFQELALSFHLVSPGDGTQVVNLGSKCLCHLANPVFIFKAVMSFLLRDKASFLLKFFCM